MQYRNYFYGFIFIIATNAGILAYATCSNSLYTLIEPTERMFAWIDTFMDKKNPKPYKMSVQELHGIIGHFHVCLDTSNHHNPNPLEKKVHTLISYQLEKLEHIYTILAHKDAQTTNSLHLGWKLSHVCEIPSLVKELDSSFSQLIKTARTVDESAACDLEQFYTHSFRPFYHKWHNKSSFYFLTALRKRLSC